MYNHSTKTASFFSVLVAALIFSLCLAGLAAAQGNTSLGTGAPPRLLELVMLRGQAFNLFLHFHVVRSKPDCRSP